MIYIFIYLVLAITLVLVGVLYGMLIYKNKIFPFHFVKKIFNKIVRGNYGPWAIGIYELKDAGSLKLVPVRDVQNPVLTGEDVTDIDAVFVADPFVIKDDNKYTMFFEVLERTDDKGVISYAQSTDGKKWKYGSVIINEDFHLSYPYVFKWEDEFYMIPESYQDLSVRLYKATDFPSKWEYQGNLISGFPIVDSSIFRHNEKWWLFVSDISDSVLNLYYSDDLFGDWKPHKMNPIVKNSKHYARPAGRVICRNNKVYRLAQDVVPVYGTQVFAFEIIELTETTYAEKMIKEPITKKSGQGWNAVGMHHIDLFDVEEKTFAVVDGRRTK